MVDILKIIGSIISFLVGFYIIKEVIRILQIPFGSLFIGLFIFIGIIWFIKEVMEG